MPQIFHPSLNTVSRVSIFGGAFILAAVLLIGGMIVRSPYATEAGVVRVQPVPFSHAHHVGEIGIDCRYCHQTVESSAYAGLPSTEVCLDCHSQLWADSPMLAPVRESYRTGEPLRWTRVHDLPDFVFFHHGIHVHKGIACEVCHGEVDQMPLMHQQNTLHMEWCLECHRDPEQFVRDRKDVLKMADDRRIAETKSAGELIKDYHIHSRTNCSTCHR